MSRDTQAKHQAIIGEIGENLANDGYLLKLQNDVDKLKAAYTTAALALVGVAVPTQLRATDPAHVVVIATRADLHDTSVKLTTLRAQRSDLRAWQKYRAAEAAITSAGIPKVDVGLPGVGLPWWALLLLGVGVVAAVRG